MSDQTLIILVVILAIVAMTTGKSLGVSIAGGRFTVDRDRKRPPRDK